MLRHCISARYGAQGAPCPRQALSRRAVRDAAASGVDSSDPSNPQPAVSVAPSSPPVAPSAPAPAAAPPVTHPADAAAAVPTPTAASAVPTAPTAAAAAQVSGPSAELLARRKLRVTAEVIEAARKARVTASQEQIRAGLETLELLVPGFTPNLDTLKASEWARLAADAPAAASKIILLKTHFPKMDLARVLVAQPKLLLKEPEQLDRAARQVRSLLCRAKEPERLLAAEPALMDPRALISVLITVTKWYYLERDPVEVLEADPDLVRRAQDYDVPFEPVYMDEQGNWTAPLLNYQEKRTEWQKYIDQTFYKQP